MSGFENDVLYAKNADFTVADNQNVSESNGLVTNGKFWIGSTATNVGGTHINVGGITSSSLDVNFSSPNITIETKGGGQPVESFVPNSGVIPVTPTPAGLVNVTGTGSVTVVGTANTLTPQLTGLTNHAVLVGAGTATITKVGPTATSGQILQSAGSSADPAFSTATYPSTTTVSQILYSSATNVVGGLATANSAALVTTNAGVPVFSSTMTNGQLIIGSTTATPTAATLTAGTGIAITNAPGSITIAATTGGFTWTDVSGAFSPLAENGYFITGTATGTLPASPSQGDTIKFFVDHASQVLTIQATAGKIIRLGSLVSSSGGTFVSTAQGDSVALVYRSSDTCWCAVAGFTGTWTLT
jgi:hypothetical protein